MAYELTRTSPKRIDTASAFSATGVNIIHIRYRLLSIPSGNGFPNRYKLFSTTSNATTQCPYIVIGSTITQIGFYNTNYQFTDINYTQILNEWVSMVVLWDFSLTTATLKLFINGTQVGSTYTVARGTPAVPSSFSIGTDGMNNEASHTDVADFGFWNTELTASEISSLAKGFPCRRIRPQSLIRDIPLIRNLQDSARGTTVTAVNSPTVSTHPRSYP